MLAVLLGMGAAGAQSPGPSTDLNTASSEQLQLLPALGRAKARAWMRWRAVHGPCREVADLRAVPGFGEATIRALATRAACGRAGDAARTSSTATTSPVALPPALSPRRIDPNVATVHLLGDLPGISAGSAARIVAHREAHGPFATCEGLREVPGIGAAALANALTRCEVAAR